MDRKVISTLLTCATFLALCQAIMIDTGFVLGKSYTVVTIYFGINILIFIVIVFFQMLTMQSSRVLHNQQAIVSSKKTKGLQN